MSYRPLPPMARCPNCRENPDPKYRWFRGFRAECICGMCGPYVQSDPRDALIAWDKALGGLPKLSHPPPASHDA